MLNLSFDSTEEFESLFSYQNEKIAKAVYKAIEESYLFSRRTAKLFTISFKDTDVAYEITLPKRDWPIALDTVLKYFEKIQDSDACIDTWKLKNNIEKT